MVITYFIISDTLNLNKSNTDNLFNQLLRHSFANSVGYITLIKNNLHVLYNIRYSVYVMDYFVSSKDLD